MEDTQSRYRVLVADDDRDAAETFAALVGADGHEAQMAFDGKSALAIAVAHEIDVAVLDLDMPNLNVYDVAWHLRTNAGGRALYLIALTGWTGLAQRAAARAAGFDAFLLKPLEFPKFQDVIRDLRSGALASLTRPDHDLRRGASPDWMA